MPLLLTLSSWKNCPGLATWQRWVKRGVLFVFFCFFLFFFCLFICFFFYFMFFVMFFCNFGMFFLFFVLFFVCLFFFSVGFFLFCFFLFFSLIFNNQRAKWKGHKLREWRMKKKVWKCSENTFKLSACISGSVFYRKKVREWESERVRVWEGESLREWERERPVI